MQQHPVQGENHNHKHIEPRKVRHLSLTEKKLTQILVYEKQLCLEQMVENKEPKKGQQGYRTQDTKQASVSNSVMSIYT